MDALHVGQCQIRQVAAAFLGHGDQCAGHMMRLAEGEAQFPHQPIGKVRRGGKARGGGLRKDRAVRGHVRDHPGHRGKRQHQRIGGVEDLFLVFLHVLGIGQRQPLHHGEQRHRRPHDPPQLGAQQLCRVGVLLLRHDAAARGPAIRQAHEAELGRGPDHQLFRKARQVHGADAAGGKEFQREVAVADAVQRIGRGPVEAQRPGRHVAVDGEGGACQRRSTQGAFVHPRAGIHEAAPVARQHFHIGHHVMPPCHGLRRLQMGEARHDPIRPGLGLGKEGADQRLEPRDRGIALVAHPETEIHRHLIVARPGGVQAPCRFADDLFQAGFHVHVDVFQLCPEREDARFNL